MQVVNKMFTLRANQGSVRLTTSTLCRLSQETNDCASGEKNVHIEGESRQCATNDEDVM